MIVELALSIIIIIIIITEFLKYIIAPYCNKKEICDDCLYEKESFVNF